MAQSTNSWLYDGMKIVHSVETILWTLTFPKRTVVPGQTIVMSNSVMHYIWLSYDVWKVKFVKYILIYTVFNLIMSESELL